MVFPQMIIFESWLHQPVNSIYKNEIIPKYVLF